MALDGKDGNTMTVTYKAVSVDEKKEDVIRNASQCLMLPVSLVKNQFWDRSKENMKFNIDIKRSATKRPSTSSTPRPGCSKMAPKSVRKS